MRHVSVIKSSTSYICIHAKATMRGFRIYNEDLNDVKNGQEYELKIEILLYKFKKKNT